MSDKMMHLEMSPARHMQLQAARAAVEIAGRCGASLTPELGRAMLRLFETYDCARDEYIDYLFKLAVEKIALAPPGPFIIEKDGSRVPARENEVKVKHGPDQR